MAMHINARNILKIGYLNFGIASEENPGRTMEKYAKEYDIVLPTEASLDLPELLTRYVLDLESEDTVFKYLEDNICSEEEGKKSLFDLVEKSKPKFQNPLGSLISSRI